MTRLRDPELSLAALVVLVGFWLCFLGPWLCAGIDQCANWSVK